MKNSTSHLPPSLQPRRKSSTLHYSSFPTKPPTSKGRPPPDSNSSIGGESNHEEQDEHEHNHESPLPKKQLAILAVIALAEQTALNSISPYLPDMAATFPEVNNGQVGLYVGLIASSFALAQFATNFFWGWLSDRIGRKPVVLLGTILTAACFVAFGFCKTLWQAVLVQILMGLVNGNQGVISTCLGEITDRSNQSRAFTYLPVVYGIGGITGPVVGGLLVFKEYRGRPNPYPYLFPNLLSAGILVVDLVLTAIFLEESLEQARDLPPLGKRMGSLFSWIWQFAGSSTKPTYLRRHRDSPSGSDTEDNDDGGPKILPAAAETLTAKEVLNRDTILLLLTFLIFQLANISYNSLYPIFGEGKPPTGRDLNPEEVGLSLAFAGIVTIVFQVFVFGKLKEKIGNKTTYRISLGVFVVAFVLMPFVGYKEKGELGISQGKVWLWIELGVVLILKTVASVGGLTSALLLITNSAPNHNVLGTLNGLAQTLSAAGRAVGPFISGSLFSAATKVQPKGEAIAFGVFGGITFIGFLLSFGIRGSDLESEDYEDQHSDDDEEEGSDEETPLMSRRS